MSKWLTIIGMGEDGYDGLSAAAKQCFHEAEIIVSSERLLNYLPPTQAEIRLWPQPFSAVVEQIKLLQGRKTIILATGDPMNFGVARKLLEFIPFSEMTIIPHLSSFSLAAARMGWSLPDCDTITLHGRDVENIEAFIQPNAKLIVLTADALTISRVAIILTQRGFGTSKITVLENMGGSRELISHHFAESLTKTEFSDLNTLAIECISGSEAQVLSRVGGLPDDAFRHDGQLTKREVRAATLSALAPAPDQLLWDIGAGCGSVSIEWMRSTRGCHAIAFEHNDDRLKMIGHNACQLGTPRLKIIAGKAPAVLENQPRPDAVFIGGGVGNAGVFDAAWAALKPGGRLVSNVVTIEGEMHLYDLQKRHGGELVRIDVSNLTTVGPYRAMKPRMAVTQWRVQKPW
jgi:precorrin-6B C5,15-methyltransferase / cobalt-precorrin-6B C5,C15-methyltransferase